LTNFVGNPESELNEEEVKEKNTDSQISFKEKDPKRDEDDLEKLTNRQMALDLLGLGELSRDEKMRKVEHQNYIYSYLVDDSYKMIQDNDPNSKEFEELDHDVNPHNNRLIKKLDRGAEWGLGGEILKRTKSSFKKDKIPTPFEVSISNRVNERLKFF
jgi:hypothetical protein